MPPKSKKQLKDELKANITFIRTHFPDYKFGLMNDPGKPGEMTFDEAALDVYVDERYQIREEYSKPDYKTAAQVKAEGDAKVKNYSGNIPQNVGRHLGYVLMSGYSNANNLSEEKLVKGLTDDSDAGRAARSSYVVNSFNMVRNVDRSFFTEKKPLKEVIAYGAQNTALGASVQELNNMSRSLGYTDSGKNTGKIKAAQNLGAAVGTVLMDSVEIARSDYFITLPLDTLSQEQAGIVAMMHPNAKKDSAQINKLASWWNSLNTAKDDYAVYDKTVKDDDIDISLFNVPRKEYSFLKIKQSVLNSLELDASLVFSSGRKEYAQIVRLGKQLKNSVENYGRAARTEGQEKELADKAKEYTEALKNFIENSAAAKSGSDADAANISALKGRLPRYSGFADENAVKNSFEEYEKDAAVARNKTGLSELIGLFERASNMAAGTEGNLTRNSKAYDDFSSLLKKLPGELRKLEHPEDMNFDKIRELIKPVIKAADDYVESHRTTKLNSRQYDRLRVMSWVKDLGEQVEMEGKRLSDPSAEPVRGAARENKDKIGKNEDIFYKSSVKDGAFKPLGNWRYLIAERCFSEIVKSTGNIKAAMDFKTRNNEIEKLMNNRVFRNSLDKYDVNEFKSMMKIPADRLIEKVFPGIDYKNAVKTAQYKQKIKESNAEYKKGAAPAPKTM